MAAPTWNSFVAPALAPVVLDHLAAHKVTGVRPLCRAIAAAGASILYLPPYSPDLAAGSRTDLGGR